jgi:hypothetical protein
MHAFPSNQDMENLVNEVKSAQKGSAFVVAAKLFAGLFWLANADPALDS